MKIGLVGLPKSGKSSLFNLLTGQSVATSSFGTARGEMHTGVARVLDERVDRLSALFKPKKTTYASFEVVDLAGIAKGERQGLEAKEFRNADALLHVVRAFPDATGAAPNPKGDIADVETELILADLEVVERRLERLEASLKKKRTDADAREQAILLKVKPGLESEMPIRAFDLSESADRHLAFEARLDLEENGLLAGIGVRALLLQRGLESLEAPLHHFEVGKNQLGLNIGDVPLWVRRGARRVGERSHHVQERVRVPELLGLQPLALALGDARQVHDSVRRVGGLPGLEEGAQPVHALVGHPRDTGVHLAARGTEGRRGHALPGEQVEQRRLAALGEPDQPDLHEKPMLAQAYMGREKRHPALSAKRVSGPAGAFVTWRDGGRTLDVEKRGAEVPILEQMPAGNADGVREAIRRARSAAPRALTARRLPR